VNNYFLLLSCNNNSWPNDRFFAGRFGRVVPRAIKDGHAKTLRGNVVKLGFKLVAPTRAAPHRPTLAARITRAYLLRQQPVEAPGAWTARGSFMWRSMPYLKDRVWLRGNSRWAIPTARSAMRTVDEPQL
jgi:hypothetical protein